MEFLAADSRLGAVSRFCFGCEQLGGVDWGDVDVEEIMRAVALAAEQGVNFFDTAGIYGLGKSESRLAEALGESRVAKIIATKGGLVASGESADRRATVRRDASASSLERCVDDSLERLGVSVLPVFYVHWPDPDVALEETFVALRSLRDDGRIARIGLSNFTLDALRAAEEWIDVDVIQLPANLLQMPESSLLEFCRTRDIAVCAYGVLAQGLLTGKYDSDSQFGETDRRHRLRQFGPDQLEENLRTVDCVRTVAKEAGRAPAEVAIRFVLQTPGVSAVVVGIKSRAQLAGCLAAFDWQLTSEQMAQLARHGGER